MYHLLGTGQWEIASSHVQMNDNDDGSHFTWLHYRYLYYCRPKVQWICFSKSNCPVAKFPSFFSFRFFVVATTYELWSGHKNCHCCTSSSFFLYDHLPHPIGIRIQSKGIAFLHILSMAQNLCKTIKTDRSWFGKCIEILSLYSLRRCWNM